MYRTRTQVDISRCVTFTSHHQSASRIDNVVYCQFACTPSTWHIHILIEMSCMNWRHSNYHRYVLVILTFLIILYHNVVLLNCLILLLTVSFFYLKSNQLSSLSFDTSSKFISRLQRQETGVRVAGAVETGMVSLARAKCTEIWSEKVPDLFNLGFNLTHFGDKPPISGAGIPASYYFKWY